MPRTWVRVLASVRFSIVPLRPFLCAAFAKRWKVQFRKGLHKFNNVDSKTTYFNENCCIIYIYISMHAYIYIRLCYYIHTYIQIHVYIHVYIYVHINICTYNAYMHICNIYIYAYIHICNKLNNFDSNNGIPTSKNTILNKQNQMWTSKEKIM